MNLYKILPICSLLFIACSDENSDSIFKVESENLMSSSWIASSSSNSRNDVNSSSSIRNDVSSSSQTVILSSSDNSTSSSTGSSNSSSSATAVAVSSSVTAPMSSSSLIVIPASSGNLLSSSSRHSGLDPESSSSRNDVSSSSSITAFSSSAILAESSSSATVALSSSSETLADPTKLFDIRVPNQEALFCMDSSAYTVFKRYVEEKDLICSFKYDGDEGFVYVQSNPAKCIGSELTPVYDVHKAEFFVNGSKQEITDVEYYGGGSHGTYSIRFTYKGKVFDYGYSTMGMGGRPCQDVDCMNVYEADGKTLVQNGCVKRERSLPVVCRHAKKDGTFSSFEDTYHICESDIFED
ncbi:MAG: hypothetical protein IKH55_01170 [Fibrobacter sp.]|nr:hypothetical protein [Fibrobacter sp.]